MKTIEKTVAEERKEASEGLTVCFVCTGNTCRSPMAAALVNDLSRVPPVCSMCDIERLLSAKRIRATSAGLFATGAPIAEHAAGALERAGIRSLPDNPYREHISGNLDAETVQSCDVIVGMTSAHTLRLLAAFPEHAGKITSMPEDIPDPFGMDAADYDATLRAIECGVRTLFFAEDEHESGNS